MYAFIFMYIYVHVCLCINDYKENIYKCNKIPQCVKRKPISYNYFCATVFFAGIRKKLNFAKNDSISMLVKS